MRKLRDMVPSPSALFAFEAAARLGGFTRAADELGITQAAVSYSVRTLERELGTALFTRLHRRIELTDNGRRFYNDVSLGLQHISRSADELRRLHGGRHVTLTASTAFSSYWMLPRLARLKRELPGVDVRLQTSDRDVDLVQEGLSLGIRRGRGEWHEYESRLFETEEILAVCSPDHLARVGPIAGPAALCDQPLIHLEEPYRPCPNWTDWFARQGLDYEASERGLRLNDYALAIHAALAGEGIILGWRHLVGHLLAAGSLVPAVAETYRSDFGFHVIWPRRSSLNSESTALRDWLVEQGGTVERPAAGALAEAPVAPVTGR